MTETNHPTLDEIFEDIWYNESNDATSLGQIARYAAKDQFKQSIKEAIERAYDDTLITHHVGPVTMRYTGTSSTPERMRNNLLRELGLEDE